VPDQIDGDAMTALIDPLKDVDGLTPVNAGLLVAGRPGMVPATPAGCMELLRAADTPLEGAEAVVVGRSMLVGKPIASLLLAANATVTQCHSRTRDLAGTCRRADVIVAAVGVPELVTGDMVKEGVTVIDVGMNRTEDGLKGDVHFDSVREKARAITPVPGGVGPMTIAMLLQNTLTAARMQAGVAARS
jgi:methylenetetrahydrofolate dehydrogenase (NADP+)/methenyltetrahydrofolate cyclohydrolase